MKNKLIILGIESTAHTFGIGIVDSEGTILANEVDSFICEMGGMIIEEVVEHHEKVADKILNAALKKANIKMEDVDLIAYSAGPGLDPVLWVGYHKAKKLSDDFNIKLAGINHCCSHLSIGKLVNDLKDPVYLYVSGVNTQLIVLDGGKYRIMGETLDIGLGNMLDKFGRALGLGFPAGAEIEKLALKGKYIELPYVVKGMDVSFSGILSKVQQLFEKGASKEDLCFSVQEICFAMLTEVSERALAHTSKNELILVGGVGANRKFCEMLEIMCKERSANFYKVPMDLARDNGAMIAYEGFLRKNDYGDVGIKTFWRTDDV